MYVHLTHTNVWESMGRLCSCAQYMKSCFTASHTRIRISTKVMQELVSGTTSHVHCIWTCNEIKGSYDKSLSPWYQATCIPEQISLVCCRWHCYLCCTLVTIQTATNSWYFPAGTNIISIGHKLPLGHVHCNLPYTFLPRTLFPFPGLNTSAEIAQFHNPVPVTVSSVVRFQNVNEPLQAHLALTGNPAEMM